ncbi:hypothetical protein L9H26_06605 [Morganella psychrotolerans]|uniref:Uncharacterized protein n=1 Tax=Morganella psychrotolerans TaxID=368603 RepID=A0A5M9R9N3_9GAMM|nr:hypothetical protein [Morganella psychrotolerans]KAA8716999.1 hypothetical protein F4V73_03755 [Morganella psychrotolerans]OBU08675.1 hypothetical protein AYY16_05275 [Morganella psychrotolerans]
MRELNVNEFDAVNGGFGLLAIPAGLGLLVSIPTIVAGAVLGPVTGGLGFGLMAAGIVGTALSGAGMIASIVFPIL